MEVVPVDPGSHDFIEVADSGTTTSELRREVIIFQLPRLSYMYICVCV